MKVHRVSSSSPTRLYKSQGPQHDFCKEESQAMATFSKQAHGEKMCHTSQLLGTQKDKGSLYHTNQKLALSTPAPATLSQGHLAPTAPGWTHTGQPNSKTLKKTLANAPTPSCWRSRGPGEGRRGGSRLAHFLCKHNSPRFPVCNLAPLP